NRLRRTTGCLARRFRHARTSGRSHPNPLRAAAAKWRYRSLTPRSTQGSIMKLSIFHVDAFTNEPFKGNPAGVVPLNTWLPEADMQAIATENNLSETAFFVRDADG